MRKRRAAFAIGVALLLPAVPAFAQQGKTLIGKSGETVDILPVYGERGCKSNLVAPPEVEVLQAPPELKISVREEMVKPRRCREKIKGGVVIATVGEVKEPVEAKLAFRVKYKSKEETHQSDHLYNVSLFPK